MLSDCEKCWDTPCECGHQYKDWDFERRLNLASVLLDVEKEELKKLLLDNPKIAYSYIEN